MTAIRRAFVVALVACTLFAAAPQPGDAANFAGSWSLKGVLGTVAANGVCTFRQSRNSLSGYCLSPGGRATAAGAVNGSRITWQIHNTATNSKGLSGIGTFRGALVTGSQIRGTWTTSLQPGVGTFVATRV